MKIKNNYKAVINTNEKNLHTLYKSILIGLLVGVVTSAYRLTLIGAEKISFRFYDYINENPIMIPVAFLILGGAGYLVGWLVNRFKMISGSGIPQVKGTMMGYFKNHWQSTLIAKFVGGAVSILGGLSLGREGPSIQLGASVAQGVGDQFASSRTEKKVLIASGAGAGLAAAFNAPLAGAMFAMEEIFKYFSPVILVSTMVSAVAADFVSKMIFGMEPVFQFTVHNSIPLSGYWILFVMGAVLGVLGSLYNYSLLSVQKVYQHIGWLNVKTRPIIPFLFAGVFGLLFPVVLGGGHKLVAELQFSSTISYLLLLLVIKFFFSMISFGSGAPGGIFFPLLVMGAAIGAIFGNISVHYLGFNANVFYNFVILAMAGFFTAIVRAPITGVILLVEMTGSFSHLLSLIVVSIVAYIVADLLKSVPIYDALLENMVTNCAQKNGQDEGKRITIESVVQFGSYAEKRLVREIEMPQNCLLIAIRRHGKDIIPKGNTKILAEDYLILLTDICDEAEVREKLKELATSV